ncbi:MAG: nucleoside monophosphate kinase, partial [Parcubacteria group bacterium]|nr:nucleoside monophosphate kinase [Parcubacteria group bacterium]
MHQQHPTLVLLGSAGSGKGTQADLLIEQFGYYKVEAGALFRAKATEDSALGRQVKEINDRGGFAPDDLIADLIDEAVLALPHSQPLLFDNYPVSIGQARRLEATLKTTGRSQDVIAAWIRVEKEEARRRLLNRSQCLQCKTVFMSREQQLCPKCGGEVKPRTYDTPVAIDNRLKHFWDKIISVLDYYRAAGRLVEVNG